MDVKELRRLLQRSESPKLDFKRELHLDTKKDKGEFYKDIIAIANGNVGTANETGYLIIGADDKLKPDQARDLFDVGTLVIDSRDTLNSLQNRCHPPFISLTCERVELDGKNLFVITIPPSDFLYELTQTLRAKDRDFKEGDVLIRREDGEATLTASNEVSSRIRREKANRHKSQKSELYEKLTSPNFIADNIKNNGLKKLLEAYSTNLNNLALSNPLDKPEILRILQATFRLAETTLTRDTNQLSSQLIGRLLFMQDSDIQEFLKKVREYQEDQNVLWLEPLSSSLTPPIAFLLHHDLREHRKPVTILTIDIDSRKLFSASLDGQLKVWNIEQLDQNDILCSAAQKHSDAVTKVIIMGDRYTQKLISASADCTVKVWGISEGRLLFDFKEHEDVVNSIALTPDCQQIISASDDRKLRVWNLIDGDVPPLIKEFDDLGTTIFLATEGQCVFFSTDRFINIWNLSDDNIYQIPAHEARINTLYLFPDQQRLISASDDESLKIWEVEQGIHLLATKDGYRSLSHVSITPDGKFVVFVDDDDNKNFVIWDWEHNQIKELKNHHEDKINHHDDEINALAIVSHGKWLITGAKDQKIQAWDLEHQRWLGTIQEYKNDEPVVLTVTPDGQYLIIALDDKSLEIWKLLDSKTTSTETHTNKVVAIEFVPTRKWMLSISEDQSLKLWQINDGSLLKTFSSTNWISAYAIDNHRLIFASGDNGTLVLQDLASLEDDSKIFEESLGKVNKIVFIPETNYAVLTLEDKVSGLDGTSTNLIAWDLEIGVIVKYLEGHASRIDTIFVNPDKKFLISSSADKTLIWSLEDFELLYTFSGQVELTKRFAKYINSFPVERYIVCESGEKDLDIWDLSNGKLLFTLPDRKDKVSAIVVTANGEQIISTSDENNLEFWSINDKEKPSYYSNIAEPEDASIAEDSENSSQKSQNNPSIQQHPSSHSHSGTINSIVTTRCNRYVISASDDRTVKVWSLADGSLLTTFVGESEMTACSVLDDDLIIIAGEKSGRVHFLKLQGI